MRIDPRQKRLEEIALGDVDPSNAFLVIRELLVEDARRFGKRVYLALQDVVWRLVADRKMDDEAIQWLDVCGRASMMMRQGGEEAVGHRVAALSDLIERAIQFFQNQPLDEVLARRHVSGVLVALRDHQSRMNRSVLLEATGLRQSNLTRVLKLLQAHGLVTRSQSGREAEISLTEQGASAAARLAAAEGFEVALETLAGVSRVGLTVSTPEDGVSSANRAFHDVVGISPDAAFALISGGDGPEDLMTVKDRWLRRLDIGTVNAGTLSLWVDVSDLRVGIDQTISYASTLKAQIARLKEELFVAQAQASAAEQHLQRERQSVNFLRERAVGRLSSVADLVRRGENEPMLGFELDAADGGKTAGGKSAAGMAAGWKSAGAAKPAHGKTPDIQIVEVCNAIDRLLRAEATSEQPGLAWRRGPNVVGEIVKSASTLSEAKYAFHPPEWADEVNLGAFARPLGHVLLCVDGDVDVAITEEDGKIVVSGVGRDASGGAAASGYLADLERLVVAGISSDSWKDNGVSVEIVHQEGGGKSFNLSMPKATAYGASEYGLMEEAPAQHLMAYISK